MLCLPGFTPVINVDHATGEIAGKLAVQGAVPLQFNAYKVPLMRNLVKRAIGGVQEATWTS